MGHRNSQVRQEQIDWRRDKVLGLAADGYSIREIESILKIPHSTVGRDLILLKKQAKENNRKYIEERVPFEYHKTIAGLEGIIKSMSEIISKSTDNKEIMAASNVKMQAMNMKMELVSNGELVHDAIHLVEKYKDVRGLPPQNGKVLIDGSEQPT